jgi:iron complex transport system substrate-binding protein
MKGNQTIKTPVNRIVCLNGGLAEVICALGGADKIVARTDDVVFPTSLLGLPSMGTNAATTTNLEAILSLNPDLVVSNSALSADVIATIKSGDIPVIIENTADPARVNTIVTNFGKILNNPAKAAEIVNNTQYYTDLIQQRLQSVSDKTTFYYEFSKIWYSMTNKTVMGSVLFSCGGQNIATNVSVSYTTLSPEYVAESNPDVILYSLSGTTNLTDYKTAYDNLIGRSVLQDVSAIKDGRVHVFYYYLAAGIRYPVGELYFAKWFYPTLFADIDPDAVHAQLIQQYFGLSLTGTYTYSGPTATVSSLTIPFLSVIADTAYNTPTYTYKLTAADVVAPLKKYAVESIKNAP